MKTDKNLLDIKKLRVFFSFILTKKVGNISLYKKLDIKNKLQIFTLSLIILMQKLVILFIIAQKYFLLINF